MDWKDKGDKSKFRALYYLTAMTILTIGIILIVVLLFVHQVAIKL